jgi:protein-tyrosine phosphatase
MIDVHTHILPGIDDGASSLEETRAMAALAADDGITGMVATPHHNFHFQFDPDRCAEELKRVRQACSHVIRLYLGCELQLTVENIKQVLARPRQFTLNGGDCLLVELPSMFTPSVAAGGLKECFRAGLRPIIAHPERNSCLQRTPDSAERLVDLGCYFQITAQSLSGAFGTAAEKSAVRMLKRRWVHFIASDCHGATQRKPLLQKAYNAIVGEFGASNAELLFALNPRSAVHSQPIQLMQPARQRSIVSRLASPIVFSRKSKFWSPTA